jgi:hypothetical protein
MKNEKHRQKLTFNKMTQHDVYDIATFCARHSISRAFFYILLRRGDGPQVMKVGKRTLISADAAAAWRQRMEQASKA